MLLGMEECEAFPQCWEREPWPGVEAGYSQELLVT